MLWCGTMDVFGEDTIDPVHKNKRKTKNKKQNSKGERK
jgi:hypothetical protein